MVNSHFHLYMISPAYCFSRLPFVHVTVVMRLYINELDTHLAPNLALSVTFSNTHTYSHSLVWSFYTFVHTLTHTHKSRTFCCTRTLCSVAERSWVEMSEVLSVTHTSMIQSLEVTMSVLLASWRRFYASLSLISVCAPIGSPCSFA